MRKIFINELIKAAKTNNKIIVEFINNPKSATIDANVIAEIDFTICS